jgi:hypothetical protein
MICHDTARGVGSFLRAIEKKMGWLPTMATHWAKQLSLSKAMNSDQAVKKNFNSKQQTEKLHFIIITYLFQRSFKRCKPITVLKISKS